MSSMASNYDMSRLLLGLGIAAMTCLFSLIATLATSRSLALFYPLLIMTIAYGVMMFASSYVEEEHHFFYWMTSAWLAFLTTKQLRK
jgi:ethanolamine phosphate transferase 2 subunit G